MFWNLWHSTQRSCYHEKPEYNEIADKFGPNRSFFAMTGIVHGSCSIALPVVRDGGMVPVVFGGRQRFSR